MSGTGPSADDLPVSGRDASSGAPVLAGICCWVALLAVDLAGLLHPGGAVFHGAGTLAGTVALLAGLDLLPALLLPLLAFPGRALLATFAGDRAVDRARLLVASPALVALGWCWLRLGYWLLVNGHDHRLGAALWVFAAMGLAALAWALVRLVAAQLAARLPAALLRPALLLPAVVFPPTAGVAWLLGSSYWIGWALVPWGPAWRALAPLVALGVGFAAVAGLGPLRRAARLLGTGRARWALPGGAAALVALVCLGGGGLSEPLRLVHEQCAWGGHVIEAVRVATDVDRDGFSSLLGGGDCAAFDPARHPDAREIPGNGVDENCNGRDQLLGIPGSGPQPFLESHPWSGAGGWSVVLIVLDAVRADHVSFLGYPRPTTPRLAELAKSSFVFPWAYSPAATTRFSVPALLAGRSPSGLAWRHVGRNLFLARGKNLLLQERLQQAGWFTAAVTSSYDVFAPGSGLEAGFTRYDTSTVRFASERSIQGRTSREVTDAGLGLVQEAGDRQFFLYLHYMDPHAPYEDPGGPTFGTGELDRYDAEIRFTDGEVGRLLDALLQRPDAARLAVVVTADHGDQFGERGRSGHGRYVNEEEVHVPLLLRLPGATPGRIDAPVSLIDLAPTLANLLGVRQGWDRFEGRNLLPLLAGSGPPPPGTVVAETWPYSSFGERRVALVALPYKTIFQFRDRSWEVYDLLRDPGERSNLHPDLPPELRRSLEQPLEGWLEAHALR